MGSLCSCCCGGSDDDKNDKLNRQKERLKEIRQQEIERRSKSPQRFASESSIKSNDSRVQNISLENRKSKTGSGYGKAGERNSLIKYNDMNEEQAKEEKLFEEERLKKELKHSVKGGDSAYVKVKKSLHKKSLSDSQYNKQGLVDDKSKEFILVKKFMNTRGYTVTNSIGSGNYAEVYKALSNKKNKHVAVKVIDLKKANTNYRVNFLPREIAIVKQLKHKNIIKIYELSQTQNKIFMVMEWAAKGTIADWLKDNGSFPETTAWTMFKEVLEALHYMHTMRIAHRDLKLENILVTIQLNPKLSDFSYAVVMDGRNPRSQTFCGSLPYFSPEILQRIPYNPFISDVWSLGVCLFIMLNDGLPFKIGDHKVMLKKQLSSDWHFRNKVEANLSPELKSMVRKMLEPDVNKRATTAILMAEKWVQNTPTH